MNQPESKRLSVAFLYDDTLDSNDGVSQYVKTLGAWLSARGHKVSYLVGQTEMKRFADGQVYSLSKNLKVVFNGNRMSIPYPAAKAGIRQALTSAAPDIIHVQVPYSPFMAQKVIKAAAVPVVGTFHIFPAGTFVRLSARLLRLSYLGSLRRLSSIRSVSKPAQDFAREAFGIRSLILPNMVNVADYRVRQNQTDPNLVVFIGRLVARKGCSYLIRAFARAAADNPELRLVIAGRGEQSASLLKLAEKLGVAGQVSFLGFISEAEKRKLLSKAAVACYPSLYGESFGIVLIEAMAAGSAVILAGNNPGYASVMEDDPVALVNPTDMDNFSRQLKASIYDVRRRKKALARQRKLIRKYDVNHVGPLVERWYRDSIAKHS